MTSRSELQFDDGTRVPPKQAEAISDIIEYAARRANESTDHASEMTNVIACVSVSLLTTIAMHMNMDKRGTKAFMKEMKRQVMKSLKEFEEGKLETVTLDELTRRGRN